MTIVTDDATYGPNEIAINLRATGGNCLPVPSRRSCMSTLPFLHGCKDVSVWWLVADRDEPIMPEFREELAKMTGDDEELIQAWLNESLSVAELDALVRYLACDLEHDRITVAPFIMPLGPAIKPRTSGILGTGCGLLRICDKPDYPLPFRVVGHFDLTLEKPLGSGRLM